MPYTILLTIDVEDWFQVENFKQCIPFSAWPNCELRVEKNVHKILDLLDSIRLNNTINPTNTINPSNPKATFFILGWIAKRLPQLIREIQARGHEVASHGYGHELCSKQLAQDLKMDLFESKDLLENITGAPVYGYRAPSFSISDDILEIIKESGYRYDSSFNSFGLHGRYGRIKLNGKGRNGILHQISDDFFELPISNLMIANRTLPWGGGGYFRLMPAEIFRHGIQAILNKKGAYLFYLHPWEVDPDQPRMSNISRSLRFRHYVNIGKTCSKLSMLLNSFKQYRFSTCIQYIIDET